MTDSTTRITDLPETGMSGGNVIQQNTAYSPTLVDDKMVQPSYSPPSHPQYAPPSNAQNVQIQFPTDQQYRLPSRDIQINSATITQDTEVRPNYVPPAPANISDYVRDYEGKRDAKIRKYKAKKQIAEVADDLFSELQIPICVAILFFVFQMPLIHNFIHKYFSFMAIYHEDGNYNTYGIMLKSALFGAAYYGILKFVDYLTII
jgi:hypothetical protein